MATRRGGCAGCGGTTSDSGRSGGGSGGDGDSGGTTTERRVLESESENGSRPPVHHDHGPVQSFAIWLERQQEERDLPMFFDELINGYQELPTWAQALLLVALGYVLWRLVKGLLQGASGG